MWCWKHVNYLSDEEEDASKLFKGVWYPYLIMESEVQHLSPEDSLQNTYDEVENAKGSVDLP